MQMFMNMFQSMMSGNPRMMMPNMMMPPYRVVNQP